MLEIKSLTSNRRYEPLAEGDKLIIKRIPTWDAKEEWHKSHMFGLSSLNGIAGGRLGVDSFDGSTFSRGAANGIIWKVNQSVSTKKC